MRIDLRKAFERLLHWAETALGSHAFVESQATFFERTGKVFPEDPFFGARLNYFFESFLFLMRREGSPGTLPMTPFELLGEEIRKGAVVDPILADCVRSISRVRSSVFFVKRANADFLEMVDLVQGSRHRVEAKKDELLAGISKGQLVQGFLYCVDGREYLGHGLLFHPREVTRQVKRAVQLAKQGPTYETERLLERLALLHLRFLRQPTADMRRLYQTLRVQPSKARRFLFFPRTMPQTSL